MTMQRTGDEALVIRTKKADRERDEELFKLGFGAGVSKASKDMVSLPPSQQMNYRKNRREITPSKQTLNGMLDYFDSNYT